MSLSLFVARATTILLMLCAPTSCDRSSDQPTFNAGCLFGEGDSLLFYAIVVDKQDKGPLGQFAGLDPYVGSDGRLLPYSEAIWVNNPVRDPRTGRDLVGAASVNYLRSNGFPAASFGSAYYDVRNWTENEQLGDAEVYYTLAQNLEVLGTLPHADAARPYLNDSGRLKSFEEALGVGNTDIDPGIGNANIVRIFGDLFTANGIPASVLVDTYGRTYLRCKNEQTAN